jgi:hypothetical protein
MVYIDENRFCRINFIKESHSIQISYSLTFNRSSETTESRPAKDGFFCF